MGHRPPMIIRTLVTLITAILLSLSTWIVTPSALAITPITLSQLSYKDCPPEIAEGAVTSGGVTQEASCFLVVGKAENKSGKTVYEFTMPTTISYCKIGIDWARSSKSLQELMILSCESRFHPISRLHSNSKSSKRRGLPPKSDSRTDYRSSQCRCSKRSTLAY
jgi:hypothetical protein